MNSPERSLGGLGASRVARKPALTRPQHTTCRFSLFQQGVPAARRGDYVAPAPRGWALAWHGTGRSARAWRGGARSETYWHDKSR